MAIENNIEYSTAKISKRNLPLLKYICEKTNSIQPEFLDPCIEKGYEKIREFAIKHPEIKTIGFYVEFHVGEKIPMVLTTRQIDMSKSNEELDEEMFNLISDAFKVYDQTQEEKRKKILKQDKLELDLQ